MFERLWLQGEKRRDTSWYRVHFREAGEAAGLGNAADAAFAGVVQQAQRTREGIVNTLLGPQTLASCVYMVARG